MTATILLLLAQASGQPLAQNPSIDLPQGLIVHCSPNVERTVPQWDQWRKAEARAGRMWEEKFEGVPVFFHSTAREWAGPLEVLNALEVIGLRSNLETPGALSRRQAEVGLRVLEESPLRPGPAPLILASPRLAISLIASVKGKIEGGSEPVWIDSKSDGAAVEAMKDHPNPLHVAERRRADKSKDSDLMEAKPEDLVMTLLSPPRDSWRLRALKWVQGRLAEMADEDTKRLREKLLPQFRQRLREELGWDGASAIEISQLPDFVQNRLRMAAQGSFAGHGFASSEAAGQTYASRRFIPSGFGITVQATLTDRQGSPIVLTFTLPFP